MHNCNIFLHVQHSVILYVVQPSLMYGMRLGCLLKQCPTPSC